MRALYSLAVYLLTPFLLLYLLLRSLRNPDYRRRWRERFAHYATSAPPGGIVVHAVSVGEANAAAPLIRALAARFPALPMTVTCFTPTGSDRIRALFGTGVFHVYAPLDLPDAVQRFLAALQPRLIVIMETEIWPNLFFAAAKANVPVLIANARISDRSFDGYRRIRVLTRAALACVARIAAQSEQDAQRLTAIGAPPPRVEVTGNLKFDMSLPQGLAQQGEAIRAAWGPERPVLVAGSTHEGEEAPVLAAFRRVLATYPRALLVLVPRHTERFARALQAARSAGLVTRSLSEGAGCPPATQCLVVDAIGELLRYYAACDVAFVGGSLDRIGGHNLLEPAALLKPVLVGPHTFNFEDITAQLIASGGALRVIDDAELADACTRLFADADRRHAMGEAGSALVRAGQGALERTLEIASGLLRS